MIKEDVAESMVTDPIETIIRSIPKKRNIVGENGIKVKEKYSLAAREIFRTNMNQLKPLNI
jgi:hypothetical protein